MKFCYVCKENKTDTSFGKDVRSADGLAVKCLQCKRDYDKAYYGKTAEMRRARKVITQKRLRDRNREFVKAYLKEHPCVDCGLDDIRVLEFDHITDDKINNVSTMVGGSFSIEQIKKEIAKCEVRCANHHRIVTYERRRQKNQKSELFLDLDA